MSQETHASVLLAESVGGLAPRDGGVYVDATCGLGGHAEAILEASAPAGRVLGLDRDPDAIARATARLARFGARIRIVEASFSEVAARARAEGFDRVDGVLADLGVSSLQLDAPERGFSFMRAGPLDMRMGPSVGPTAAELLDRVDAETLADILREFGEVPRPRAVAEAILSARARGALTTTDALAEVVARASGGRRGAPTHPATRAFQAIRIAVNRELDELAALLAALPDLVRPGGRAAIISFHSLEDRMVKRAFEDPPPEVLPRGLPVEPVRVRGPWQVITKKPIVPSADETAANPRARSAKLRIAERRPTPAPPDANVG